MARTGEVEDLLERHRAGDQTARVGLIALAQGRFVALARAMLRRSPQVRRWEETDDLLQAALMKLHRSLSQVQPENVRHFDNLAAAQIRRELIDLARSYRGPEGLGARHHTDGTDPGGRLAEIADEAGKPESLEGWTAFHEAVERLPEAEREVVNLLWYDNMTHAQAAVALGVATKTVQRRWASARRMLREEMDGEHPGLERAGRPKDAHTDDLPRMIAGRYHLDSLIGEGGFGRVYRGFDTWLERPVAVKVPKVDRPVGISEVDLCRMEARKVARLKHPNIVAVHDVGQDNGTCFIVSDWIDGVDLASRIRRDRPSYGESARIVAEVAEALAHAHRMGFVHRDIKPANILLDHQGQAYLTDFGIAAVEEELLRGVHTAGTLPYMAPEQLGEDAGSVDHRSDIYAVGVVLYELLTGRRPSLASTPIELREQILRHDPTPPHAIEADVPEALERVCLRCLAKRPDQRYPAAEDVGKDLRAFLGQ